MYIFYSVVREYPGLGYKILFYQKHYLIVCAPGENYDGKKWMERPRKPKRRGKRCSTFDLQFKVACFAKKSKQKIPDKSNLSTEILPSIDVYASFYYITAFNVYQL
jgi:hypothetical protein